MAIPAFSKYPTTLSPITFAADMDAFIGDMPTFIADANALEIAVSAAADTATTQAGIATTQAGLATTNGAEQVALATTQAELATTNGAAQVALATVEKLAAEAAASAAAATADVSKWVSGTTYAEGVNVWSPTSYKTYRRKTAGAGSTDPASDTTNWAEVIPTGISSIVTATTATTLTARSTLLKITPASYGVAVTLPDATTCPVGGPLHIIDNRGVYPVKVLDSTGVLKGFIFAGVVSHISLEDNSTAAGVWAIENNELVGASAQLLTTNFAGIASCIALDSDREFLLGYRSSDGYVTGVVYRKSINTFGAVAVVRAANVGSINLCSAILQTTNQVLVVSCDATTAFEAVVCSVDPSTDAITPNTAATATLSAAITTFADGCGLIAVGTSFVTSYTVATPAAQISAISVSGTTVTIGAATVLDGTAGGLIAASGDNVIAVSTATTHLYTKPYTVSGSTLSAGTGTDTDVVSATMTLDKFFALGTRFGALYRDGTANIGYGAVISLSGTITTISAATLSAAVGGAFEAIVVGTSKVLALTNQTTNNANILTDTAGTASAGTPITLSSQTARVCVYVDGTDVVVQEGTTTYSVLMVDCSGASPVLIRTVVGQGAGMSIAEIAVYPGSNSVLGKGSAAVYSGAFAQVFSSSTTTHNATPRIYKGEFSFGHRRFAPGYTTARGKADSERWISDGATVITKVECAL